MTMMMMIMIMMMTNSFGPCFNYTAAIEREKIVLKEVIGRIFIHEK